MPQGHASALPSGLWYQTPTTSSVPKLLFKSFRQVCYLAAVLVALQQYRSLSWKYTYKSFIGKTMSLGRITVLDHEPLSTEEIDKMKADEAARKEWTNMNI